jgi:hypothetical protein
MFGVSGKGGFGLGDEKGAQQSWLEVQIKIKESTAWQQELY